MAIYEAAEMIELAELTRAELRKRLRGVRAAHPAASLAARSAAIVKRLADHPSFTLARSVGLFFPLLERKEVDLRELDGQARELGKRVYYPFLEARGEALCTGFREARSLAELELRGQRFAEPPPDAHAAERGEIELIIVPALAVAPTGHRLGYGAGYYDATLPDFCPPATSLIVAYDFQLLVELPVLPHDQACDGIVTDTRTLTAVPMT